MSAKKTALIALSVVLLLGVAAVVSMKWRTRKIITTPEMVLERDQKSLNDPKVDDSQLYGSLIRMAQRGDVNAQKVAIAKRTSSSILVRQACALALGYFDNSESNAALGDLLKDSDSKVRAQALEALSFRSSKAREELIEKYFADTRLTTPEKISLYRAAIRSSSSGNLRRMSIDGLAKIANLEKGVSATDAYNAASALISLAPREPKTVEFLKDVAKDGKNLAILPQAIIHLSVLQDPYIRSHLNEYANHKSAEVRFSAIQSIHFACPDDRWAILKKALYEEKDERVLKAAIEELSVNKLPQGLAIAEKVVREREFSSGNRLMIGKAIQELKKGKYNDNCTVLDSNGSKAVEKK